MATVKTVTCDQCGRTKGPSNHWIRTTQFHNGMVAFWPSDSPVLTYDDWIMRDLCGMDCLVKWLTATLAEAK